jgi:hypothetical protein
MKIIKVAIFLARNAEGKYHLSQLCKEYIMKHDRNNKKNGMYNLSNKVNSQQKDSLVVLLILLLTQGRLLRENY